MGTTKNNDLDDTVNFGQYEGRTIEDIIYINPEYLEWCISNLSHFYLTKRAYAKMKEAIRQKA